MIRTFESSNHFAVNAKHISFFISQLQPYVIKGIIKASLLLNLVQHWRHHAVVRDCQQS